MVNISTAPVNLLTATPSVADDAAPQTTGQSPIEYNALDDYYTQATDQVLTLWFNRNSLERAELLNESNSEAVDDGLTIDID
jgi:hypothetical protein